MSAYDFPSLNANQIVLRISSWRASYACSHTVDNDLNQPKFLFPFPTISMPSWSPNKILFLIYLFLAVHTGSADVLREQEISKGIIRHVDPTEVFWLGDRQNKFLSLYRETIATQTQGAVILIHDLGSNPNSIKIMKPFRDYLSKHGWMTLSLQMPVLESGIPLMEYYEKVPEATNRILAGVEFLVDQNIRNIVIIGHGFGGVFALNFLANQTNPIVTALVIIGLPSSKPKFPKSQLKNMLEIVEIPLFDIGLNRKNTRFPGDLKKRKRLLRNHKNYQQLATNEVAAQFRDSGSILVKRVYSWIMRVTPGVEIR